MVTVGGELPADPAVELAARIRRTHARALRQLARKLSGPAGEYHDGSDPVTGLPVFRPPAVEARSVTDREVEVRVAASRMSAGPELPAGSTRFEVSLSAHHWRTHARMALVDAEYRGWVLAVLGIREWSDCEVGLIMPAGSYATRFVYYRGSDGYPLVPPAAVRSRRRGG
jgi:hypothetical protein